LTLVFSQAFAVTFLSIALSSLSHQREVLQAILKASRQAKDSFMAVTCVAHEAVGLSQAFPANAMGGGIRPTGDEAGAFPS
jgi:hypothetical protein